ncbi:MAG: (2Fe-2S) ferredoxin domain-containing protein [Oscillatoriaceae bacterium SKW80]|nr:(2Fe-2S) ferredoxin domain-containing protein [Oscillatoriaceae bacterium SKYG93]MCX8120616.1 (2Fe-2S) ferredoxin domain-containing protein [Oscillatoriaceae bacterium SKW80]MDW8453845.1 (2Fe-2S) ferredoxin domain-containing protein [Oscillatoriaceae cyanobacterium SKYGB_i_bin93]HIK27076.1 (2Fe-2S) ferredoxin domain-containing protein [Oscillatoriaceae cyanobacterium M7585_C2015_266]
MSHSDKQISQFILEGKFLGFVFENGYKLKYVQVATEEGESCLKISKPLRVTIDRSLMPGTWVRVEGEKKVKKSGQVKLKAYNLQAMASSTFLPTPAPASLEIAKIKATILVCQNSDCCKRGGAQVYAALQKNLRARCLQEQVTIKVTGCLKQCKEGPIVIIMPEKARYSRVDASEISTIIDKHFLPDSCQETIAKLPSLPCEI